MKSSPTSMSSIFVHPATLHCVHFVLVAITLGFSFPGSTTRWLMLPVLGALALYLLTTDVDQCGCALFALVWRGFPFQYTMQYVDVGLLRPWSFEAKGPEDWEQATRKKEAKPPPVALVAGDGPQARLRFGVLAAASLRCCGLPFEAAHVPVFRPGDPTYVPSRPRFLRQMALKCAWTYLVLDAAGFLSDPAQRAYYTREKVPVFARLGAIGAEEAVVRVVSTLAYGATTYALIELLFAAPALLAVASGLTGVGYWRPEFGPPAAACTLRGFWNTFWHQMFRLRLTHMATFVAHDTLGLRRSTAAGRAAVLALAFAYSSLFHHVTDVATGNSWRRVGAFQFFMMQILGVVLEDLVRGGWRRLRPGKNGKPEEAALWARAVGFVWVLFWLTVSR